MKHFANVTHTQVATEAQLQRSKTFKGGFYCFIFDVKRRQCSACSDTDVGLVWRQEGYATCDHRCRDYCVCNSSWMVWMNYFADRLCPGDRSNGECVKCWIELFIYWWQYCYSNDTIINIFVLFNYNKYMNEWCFFNKNIIHSNIYYN